VHTQAAALWQWSNFLHDQVEAGKRIVRINIDETSIRLHPDTGKGCLTASTRGLKRQLVTPIRHVPKGSLRGSFSHVGIICDDPELQRKLPQFVYVPTAQITEASFTELGEKVIECMQLRRCKNSWMTVDKFKDVIAAIAKVIKAHDENIAAIVSMDVYKAHISPAVWNKAANSNIMMLVVPAHMTWALQPCDTHVFAPFKARLASLSQDMMINAKKSVLPCASVIEALSRTIKETMLDKPWAKAFADAGLNGTQDGVSDNTLKRLSFATRTTISRGLPSLEQLQVCFPRKTSIPIEAVFRTVLLKEHRASLARVKATPRLHRLPTHTMQTEPQPRSSSIQGVPPLSQPHPVPWTSRPPLPPPLPETDSLRQNRERTTSPSVPVLRRLLPPSHPRPCQHTDQRHLP
jgi:hypothetical protein